MTYSSVSWVWGMAQTGSLLRSQTEIGCQQGYVLFWKPWKRICFQAHSSGLNWVPCSYKQLYFLHFPFDWVSHFLAGCQPGDALSSYQLPTILATWPPSSFKPATRISLTWNPSHVESFSHFQFLSLGRTWSLFRAYLIRSDLPRIIALFLKSTLSYNVTEGKGLIRAQISRSHLRIWPTTVTKICTNVKSHCTIRLWSVCSIRYISKHKEKQFFKNHKFVNNYSVAIRSSPLLNSLKKIQASVSCWWN